VVKKNGRMFLNRLLKILMKEKRMLQEKWGVVKSQVGAAYQLPGLLLLFF